ncbi:MAG: SPOR domain-containing protein [Saprospiraceae bacterium]|jgi:cell division septation protein DedD|nr:SPOR domain-containing protein [Saprospiraceae bacterium]MBP9210454.1 SPOR domain-containing protein [Saprospiraceae bacterium]
MKSAINILLVALLVLLVGAIVYMIYQRSKNPVEDLPPVAEMADSLFMDPQFGADTALTPDDHMVYDLTGQYPAQVGAPAENQNDTPSEGPVDYTQAPVEKPASAVENTSPKAQKASEGVAAGSPESKSTSAPVEKTKAPAPAAKPAASKPAAVKTAAAKPAAKPSEKRQSFYVVCGSFIKPENADEQVAKLRKMGYQGAARKVFGSSEYYSAIVGTYSSREEAERIAAKLEAKGEKAFLRAK